MHLGRLWVRLGIRLSAALLAAAVGDPLLESIARRGLFGPGFGDTDQLGAFPALLLAALALLAVAAYRIAGAVSSPRNVRLRLLEIARRRPPSPLRDLPATFAVTLGAVYGIEALEGWCGAAAHAGLTWLGAPLALAAAFYLVCAALASIVIDVVLRSVVASLSAIVRTVLELFAARSAREPLRIVRSRVRHAAHSALVARHAGGRAPPPLPRPA